MLVLLPAVCLVLGPRLRRAPSVFVASTSALARLPGVCLAPIARLLGAPSVFVAVPVYQRLPLSLDVIFFPPSFSRFSVSGLLLKSPPRNACTK
jgi:hypothetical protein